MIRVRRANVVLDVPEEQKSEYLGKGFDVIGDNGKVIEHTVPSDVNTLKASYSNHLEKIAVLEKENEKLKAENKKLKSEKRKSKNTDKS